MSDSPITREIRQCMSDLNGSIDEGRVSARFLFPPEFIGFKGHFPGRPILAAVCQIQAVMAMLDQWKKRPVKMEKIIFAKFLLPISFGEELFFECRERTEPDGKTVVSALGSKDGSKATEIRIRVSFGNEGRPEDERQVEGGGKA